MGWFADWLGSWFGGSDTGGEGGGEGTNAQGLRTRRVPCRCCGGGTSGYGTGNEPSFCCGCDRFACGSDPGSVFPTTLDITVTASCMGTRTLTLNVVPFATDSADPNDPDGCNKPGVNTPETGRAVYNGSFTGDFNEGSWVHHRCDGPADDTGIEYTEEFLEAIVSCCDSQKEGDACEPGTGPDTSEWRVYFRWEKYIAGVKYEVLAYLRLTIVSCSPLSLTATMEAICDDTDVLGTDPCSASELEGAQQIDTVKTNSDEVVACSFQVDIDE